MAGRDAPGPAHRRRTVLAAIAGAVLLAAGVTTYFATRRAPDGDATAAAPRAPVTSSVVPRPSRPRPSSSSPPARARNEVVRPAVPTAFTLTGARFTIKAHVCAMADIRPYDPPGEQRHTVCWVRDGFGVRPGSGTATSYVFGHSWAEDPQEVLNRASAPVTREILHGRPSKLDGVTVYPAHVLDGYRLRLHTRAGVLTYEVRRVYAVRKLLLGGIASWENEHVRNRIVLTTCAELGGVDYDYNVVIEAYLVSSRRA